jgi:16S rRNA (guanine527-N7)-methyltransferase
VELLLDEFIESLKSGADSLGLSLAEEQVSLCARYCEILLTENQKQNLTSITDRKEVAVKHFVDSLSCMQALSPGADLKLIDVGTGAGFPGLAVKIARPEIRLTLLESQEKKIKFIEKVKRELNLEGVNVVKGRAEEAGRDGTCREKFDVAVARAVADMRVLSEYCLPLVKVGGLFLALKGPAVEEDLAGAGAAIKILGGSVREIIDIDLPLYGDRRKIVVIEKVSATPEKYPRRAGIPKKKPLGK